MEVESAAHNRVFKDAVMLRTYCREYQLEGQPETWIKETEEEVYLRVLDHFGFYYKDQIKQIPFFRDNVHWYSQWFKLMQRGKALPAGRMLWSMGTQAVDDEGFLPLMNCGFVVIDHPIKPLRFIMRMLMLGCGTGFSLEEKHFAACKNTFIDMRYPLVPGASFAGNITRDDSNPASYPVADCRDGWVNFLEHVLNAAITMRPCMFSLARIRPAGSRIKGFGGRSGDPAILESIAKRIYNMVARQANPSLTMYFDIICSIAELIVSGNVRRSALMCIGDADSEEFLALKKFDNLMLAPWRCNCNNSVNVSDFKQLSESYWNTYKGGSEPYGFVNTVAAAASEMKYHRYAPQGFNPCGEQPLANYELCCLSEVNLARVSNIDDLWNCIRMCYFFCKFVYFLPCPEPQTRTVTQANRRIGISLTGLAVVSPEVREWAYKLLLELRSYDETVSHKLGIPTSVALTTVKPGGTLPKIAGSSGPGVHRPISKFQIRRVRFNKQSKLLKWFEKLGLPIEPQRQFNGDPDLSGTQVVSFYLKNEVPHDGHFSDWLLTDEGFVDMINLVAEVQKRWSENSVSVTVYYHKEQVDNLVRPTIACYFPHLKSLSCLPYSGHDFPQAPEEPISEEEYWAFIRYHPISPWYNVPYDADDVEDQELEDFGLCESKSQCSERG